MLKSIDLGKEIDVFFPREEGSCELVKLSRGQLFRMSEREFKSLRCIEEEARETVAAWEEAICAFKERGSDNSKHAGS